MIDFKDIPVSAEVVQIFFWTDKNGREHRWLINAALEIIKETGRLPNATITRKDAEFLLSCNAHASELDPAVVERADLDKPLIIATVEDPALAGGEHVVIDGWHRIKKFSLSDRQEPLRAIVLSRRQSELIKIQ